MTNGNKTLNIQYRFLTQKDFSELYQINLAAFADYLVTVQMTESQFKNHIAQNAVNIDLSVGAFSKNKLVGYTLNGFGVWNGKKTAYDAGTGVIPEYRKQGIGKSIFEFLLPKLKKRGIEQMLLEVLSNNEKAIKLYDKLGFEKTRTLLFFEQVEPIEIEFQNNIQIRQIKKIEWEKLKSFGDGETSWQFSSESIKRKLAPTKAFGAFLNNKCIGYSMLLPTTGIVPQIAVDKIHRYKGVASNLLVKMQGETKENKKLRFCNVDSNLTSIIKFAEKMKFKQSISQFEMILKL